MLARRASSLEFKDRSELFGSSEKSAGLDTGC